MEIKRYHKLNLFWKVDMEYNFYQMRNSFQKKEFIFIELKQIVLNLFQIWI
jgi:hypothetical protein